MAGVAAALCLVFFAFWKPFPSDKTPEGAYARIAKSLSEEHPRDIFDYLELEAQWACYTLKNAHTEARDRVSTSWPPGPEREQLLAAYEADAKAGDARDVFLRMAEARGWLVRLRKDLSGLASVEVSGERATVVTARGTRYSFRKRDQGLWGLTMFTAELVVEAERASRDLEAVKKAADDYDRGHGNR
jgi:hypothetical protein